jgi:hypothetical protein
MNTIYDHEQEPLKQAFSPETSAESLLRVCAKEKERERERENDHCDDI